MEKPKNGGIENLRMAVLDMIQSEGLALGDKLPTEKAMAERFQVSRPTLREALKLLERDAVIEAQQGKGRFIAAGAALSIARPITKFESVSDMVRSHGYNAQTTVLGFSTLPADEEIAVALSLETGSPVLRVERLRHAKGEPLVYSVDWIPQKLFGNGVHGEADWAGSIVDLLADIDKRPVASTATVKSVMLPDMVVRMHNLETFGSALLIEEICYSADGSRVIFAQDYHRGSAFSFSFVRK
ncbi:GntR family transcriptional regulator [Roseibium aggregatum]|uniref:Transcriptional regulator, GntR family protein n=1 Tax=Roseibium aggregatum (strain ATCC 25650 / DSM 13394 / JCM 20685 / NBRC 16684 / NCIMB 2208 / IAM 12614 / B1) TaxID=384765 RepID=A0NZ84_ROSAI|nr:GntR family transcriptional regulator [Roseibium aggregatum]EAV41763.1 transcriptional regulator, GntR family protein [Roseibium aggregatum IAM 12614]